MTVTEAKLMKGNMLKGGKDESMQQVIPTDKSFQEAGLAGAIGKQTEPMRDLDQIIAMIMQGVNPEELIQQGIPPELVDAAMQKISKQMTQVPQEQAGLAGMSMQQGMMR